MTHPSRTASYREMEVLSAPPARLVVLLFDQLVVQLTRARIAIEKGDVVLRTESLGRTRAIVSELLSTLDFEKGDQIARDLAGIYKVMLNELVDVGIKQDLARLAKLLHIATELRDGFAGAADQLLKRSA